MAVLLQTHPFGASELCFLQRISGATALDHSIMSWRTFLWKSLSVLADGLSPLGWVLERILISMLHSSPLLRFCSVSL